MPEALAAGTVLAGRFELQSMLGRGGMATVYRAWDHARQQPCAVKILSELLSGDEQFHQRFRQEAAAAQGLAHPNIVGVYAWGEAGVGPFIVMEYVAGGTLRDLMRRCGPLPQQIALRVAVEVADALVHAHARGVVHRDIKPENLLLAEDGRVKVADFGIARTIDAAGFTQTGIVMGSARYLSPEQARGHRAGPRSDLYALGVVLFEMLSGRVPFDGDSAVGIAVQHLNEPPPRLQSLRPDVADSVAATVERLLAKREEDRPPTAASLAGDLRDQYAMLFGGFEERPPASARPLREAEAVAETARVDLLGLLPAAIGQTVALQAAGDGGATAVLPAAGIAPVVTPPAPRPAPPSGHRAEPRPLAPQAPEPRGVAPQRQVRARAARRRLVLPAALVLAALLAAGGALVSRIYRPEQTRILVPSLLGQSVTAAASTVRTVGLRIEVTGRRQDPRTPVGRIVAQDPPPWRLVDQQSVVRVVVSQGSGLVPNLRGLVFDQASRLVEAAGLRLRRVADLGAYADDADRNRRSTIVFQFQPPGTHLAPDATVYVVMMERVGGTPNRLPPWTPLPRPDGGREGQ